MNDRISPEIVSALLDAGCDVNAENRLGQTPLHYTASAGSVEKIQLLLRSKDVNKNKTDINGYSVLHTFVHSINGESVTWKTGLQILIDSAIDFNLQTDFGNSILHIAGNTFINIEILQTLLIYCPTINCTLQNKHAENFLHSFVTRGIDYEANLFFDELLSDKYQNCKRELFIRLINEQDVYGQTPFNMCLDSQELTITTIKKLLDNGADVNVQDRLGNTILHRIVALSLRNCEQVVKLICRKGADINKRNRNDQTVCSMLQEKQLQVFNILLENGADIKLADKWKRSISMTCSKFKDVNLIRSIIEKCGVNSIRDSYGATSLHWAAYSDNVLMIDALIALGADINDVDKNGYTPLDIAILFQNNEAISHLKDSNCILDQVIHTRINSEIELKQLPKAIKSDDFDKLADILPVPTDLKEFTCSLLASRQTLRSEILIENDNIKRQVKCFVEEICAKVPEYDSDYVLSVLPTGSSAEGTKVGPPDEFDFALCLEKFSEGSEIFQPDLSDDTEYDSAFACVQLKKENRNRNRAMLKYFDENSRLISWQVLKRLFFLLRRSLFETGHSGEGNLYFKFENDIQHNSSKPVFNVTFIWVGCVYKEIEISIDLLPAIRRTDWWPKGLTEVKLNEQARKAGCLLLLQAKASDQEKLIICGYDDSVDLFGRPEQKSSLEVDQRTLLRISAAPAEILTINDFPQIVRDSYMLSKIFIKCVPKILTNTTYGPEREALHLIGLDRFEEDYILTPADKNISSYMLKNCVFHVIAAFQAKSNVEDLLGKNNMGLLELTGLVFEHLFQCSENRRLPAYFLPFVDVFSFEEEEVYDLDSGFRKAQTLLKHHRVKIFTTMILHLLGSRRSLL